MKNLFLLQLFVVLTTSTYAQSEKKIYTAKYNFGWQKDSLKKMSVFSDLMVIDIYDSTSKYYSSMFHQGMKSIEEDIASGKSMEYIYNNKMKSIKNAETEVVEINYKNKKLKVSDRLAENAYYYEEKLEVPIWTLKSDTLTILNQICQKAETNYKGRNYQVWFAKNIPISLGPWQFTGLPGLILKVTDSKNQFSFICYELESSNLKKSIFNNYENLRKVPKEKLRLLKKLKATDIAAFDNLEYPNLSLKSGNGEMLSVTKIITPYNPIDLTK